MSFYVGAPNSSRLRSKGGYDMFWYVTKARPSVWVLNPTMIHHSEFQNNFSLTRLSVSAGKWETCFGAFQCHFQSAHGSYTRCPGPSCMLFRLVPWNRASGWMLTSFQSLCANLSKPEVWSLGCSMIGPMFERKTGWMDETETNSWKKNIILGPTANPPSMGISFGA